MKKIRKILVLLFLCTVVGCSSNKDTSVTTDSNGTTTASEEVIEFELLDTPDTPIRTIQINGQDLEIDLTLPSLTWFSPTQLTTLQTNSFVMRELPDYDIWIDGVEAQSTIQSEVVVEKLAANKAIEFKLVHKETEEELIYYIRTLDTAYNANVSQISEDITEGYYYFTQMDTMYKMDTSGNVVFYKKGHDRVADFKQYTFDGEIYYSYIENGISFTDEKLTDVAVTQSRAVIMNADYEVIDEIDYLATGEGITEYHSIESHDFVMLGLNHYLICGYVGANVTNIPTEVDDDGSAYVTACIVQEVIDGELIFQWDSTDFPELYGYSTECNDYDADTPQDYAHLNSVDIDPVDGNIIMSFRQLDALLKVDRETGDIIWILGGIGDQFGLTDEQLFSHQHHAKFSDDGILTFYDNGNAYEQTRVVQVILDEENMTISEYIAYGTERKYTWYMGSAMCLDQDAGLYLMGWGGRTEDGAIFSEINYVTGETLFELYDMDTGYENSSYRVYKFDS